MFGGQLNQYHQACCGQHCCMLNVQPWRGKRTAFLALAGQLACCFSMLHYAGEWLWVAGLAASASVPL
jgi:hypothetical protein